MANRLSSSGFHQGEDILGALESPPKMLKQIGQM